jgi:hypothetical protein
VVVVTAASEKSDAAGFLCLEMARFEPQPFFDVLKPGI